MSETNEKHAGGRPTLYKPEYVDDVYKLCLLGLTDEKIATFFEVDVSTINNWKKEHPEFFESLKKGKVIADSEVASTMLKRALGYEYEEVEKDEQGVIVKKVIKHMPADPRCLFKWLDNRQPEFWQDKRQNRTININVDTEKDSEIRERVEKIWKEF